MCGEKWIPAFEVVTKSIKASNHEGHEEHKGKEKALLCALRVLRGSLLFRAFCETRPREDDGQYGYSTFCDSPEGGNPLPAVNFHEH